MKRYFKFSYKRFFANNMGIIFALTLPGLLVILTVLYRGKPLDFSDLGSTINELLITIAILMVTVLIFIAPSFIIGVSNQLRRSKFQLYEDSIKYTYLKSSFQFRDTYDVYYITGIDRFEVTRKKVLIYGHITKQRIESNGYMGEIKQLTEMKIKNVYYELESLRNYLNKPIIDKRSD